MTHHGVRQKHRHDAKGGGTMRHPARLALATACGLVCAAPLRGADPGPAAVPAAAVAPAFTVTELLQPPRAGWITNGGTLYNQRHSPLTLLDRDNVAGLRAPSRPR